MEFFSLTSYAATVADILNIPSPLQAQASQKEFASMVKHTAGKSITKALLYHPDAIGAWHYQKYWEFFLPVLAHTQWCVPFRSVMPSVTPVCFASMYTGTFPKVHGIQAYEKPIVTIDSLFDALCRGGKKTALVAVEGSSMSKIFLNRNIDYFILPYDQQCKEKALALLREGTYDVISVYTQEYDDVMHRTGPESAESLQALKHQIAIFDELACAAEEAWKKEAALLTFSPDHGVHRLENGQGAHGSDLPEDLNIFHFFGV